MSTQRKNEFVPISDESGWTVRLTPRGMQLALAIRILQVIRNPSAHASWDIIPFSFEVDWFPREDGVEEVLSSRQIEGTTLIPRAPVSKRIKRALIRLNENIKAQPSDGGGKDD